MSVDIDAVPAPTPPPAATPDMAQFVIDQLKPTVEAAAAKVANQAVAGATAQAKSVVAGLQADVTQLTGNHATNAARIDQIEQQLATAGTALVANVQTDPLTQRVLIWTITGVVLVLAAFIIVSAAFGNTVTKGWVGEALIGIGTVGAWHSRPDASPAKKVTA